MLFSIFRRAPSALSLQFLFPRLFLRKLVIASLMLLPLISIAEVDEEILRGFNAGAALSEEDFRAMASMNANIVRVNFDNLPLIKKEAPYQINEAAFQKLDRILGWAKENRLRVILDMHTFPGLKSNYFTDPSDEFLRSKPLQELFLSSWGDIAKRYKKNDVIYAYELLNEPSMPLRKNGEAFLWPDLAKKAIEVIRRVDPEKYIIVEPAVETIAGKRYDRVSAFARLSKFQDERVIYSPHMYYPLKFTHQREGDPKYVYPGFIEGQFWDKNALRKYLQPISDFQKKNGVRILVGEFSASNYTGDSGLRYIKDLIEVFEENGWSWTYHDFRGSSMWNSEISYLGNGRFSGSSKDSERLVIIKGYLKKNRPLESHR